MKRVLKSELQTSYPDWSLHLDKFLEKYPEFDRFTMLAELLDGDCVLWTTEKGFVIGRPNNYHNKTVFLIEAAGGEDHLEWFDEIQDIEEEVRAWGFEEIEAYGRLGWKKLMQGRGYSPKTIVMRKTL